MNIQERDGKYRARIELDGHRHSATFDTRREAKKWLAHIQTHGPDRLARIEQAARYLDEADALGINLADTTTTLHTYIHTVWLPTKKGQITDSSYKVYESGIRCHIEPTFGDTPLGALTRADIQQWVNQMDPASVAARLKLLRSILNDAVADKLIPSSPAARIKRAPHKPRRMTFLEPHELDRVLAVLEYDWERDVVLGLVFLGCRVGDLAAIRCRDVDEVNGTIHIRDQKTGNDRTLPIPAPLAGVVKRRLGLGVETLFASGRGGRVLPDGFRRSVWNPAVEAAGLGRKVRVHDLRHTCASWLINEGLNPVQVAAWLGHATPTQTLNTYAHLWSDGLGSVADALGEVWGRRGDGPTPLRSVK